jgi:hypothetical protein
MHVNRTSRVVARRQFALNSNAAPSMDGPGHTIDMYQIDALLNDRASDRLRWPVLYRAAHTPTLCPRLASLTRLTQNRDRPAQSELAGPAGWPNLPTRLMVLQQEPARRPWPTDR